LFKGILLKKVTVPETVILSCDLDSIPKTRNKRIERIKYSFVFMARFNLTPSYQKLNQISPVFKTESVFRFQKKQL
jgi:hypothetical protein